MKMDAQIDNKDQIKEFVNIINKIEQLHKNGKLYCETKKVWNDSMYHSNLVYYSDELKENILSNKEKYITYYDDIYYAFIETYINITGYKPKPMLHLNKTWVVLLDRKLICENKKKKAFIRLFIKCVLNNTDKKIIDISDIKETDEYKIIVQ